MKKTSALFLILTVALMGICSQASAEDSASTTNKPSNYIVFKGGIYAPADSNHDLDKFYNNNIHRLDAKTGFNGEVAIGHYFLPILAVELGGGYFESKGSALAQIGETKLQVVPVVATAKILLPLGPVEPYGMFGVGAYFTKLDITGTPDFYTGSSEITYGFHAGAGLNINLTDHLFLGAEGRYLWADPSFGGHHLKLDGFTTTANLGLRF